MKDFSLTQSRKGYVLPWVIILFLLVSLLSTVIVSASAISVRSTQSSHNSRQAYYSARSAAAAVVDYILKNGADDTALARVLNATGSGSNDLLGDYTVEVYGISDNRIKVTAVGSYQGQQSTVTATLSRQPGEAFGILPSENLVFLTGGGSSVFGQGHYNGDLYVNGNFVFGHGSILNGRVVVTGNILADGGSHLDLSELVGFGDITLAGSAALGGDVLTNGSVTMNQGNSSIQGNLSANGSLYMQNGSDHVVGNAYIGGDVFFGGGENRVRGSLSYGGTAFAGGVPAGKTQLQKYARGEIVSLPGYQPVLLEDINRYKAPESLPIISPPALSQELSFSGTTISSSGVITPRVYNNLRGLGYGTTVTVDTGGGDISLLIQDLDFNVGNGTRFEVTGPGNVYIYLTGSSSFHVEAQQYIGMQVRGSNPRLFIIGDGAQTVTATSSSSLNACVYLPKGTFNASGSIYGMPYKFVGVIMANQVNISSNIKLQYSPVNLNGTPLEGISAGEGGGSVGGGGGTPGNWKLEGWDNR